LPPLPSRRFVLLACLLLVGASSARAARPPEVPRDDASFHTVLTTPPPRLDPSPVLPGSFRLHLDRFGTLQRPGAPAVPVRIERVAIPEAAVPQLRVLRLKSRILTELHLAPVPTAGGDSEKSEQDAPGSSALRNLHYRPDPELYSLDADYPSAPLALGEIGRLRNQRFVELIFTPVQVNPVTGRGRIVEEVELEVVFTGVQASRPPSVGRRGEGRFEQVYRHSLLNYEQGRQFRLESATSGSSELPGPLVETTGSGTIYKLALRQDGLYRVSCSSVPSCSVPDLLGINPNTFRLRNKGVEVPMRVLGGGDDSFDLGDVLEFYGQSQKEPFTTLNCGPPTCPTPIYQYNDVTDVNVYLLDATASTARLRMATVEGTPGGLSAEPHFLDTAHWEVNDRFLPLDTADPFYSSPTLTADAANPAARDISIPIPGLASTSFTAPVLVRLRGVSTNLNINPDHRTRITVNGSAPTLNTADWDGEMILDQTTTASQSILTNPSTLHLEVPVVAGLSIDQVIADFVEISYRRLFQAASDQLAFDFPNQAAKFTITGFSGGSIAAYDLSRVLSGTTDTLEPRLVINGSATASALTFQVATEGAPTGTTRRFRVVGPGGYVTPESVTPMSPTTLLDPANEADYLIVAHSSLVDLAPTSPYSQFISYLETTRLLKTRLVTIEEIYDTFNDSIAHPEAIRTFLAYAHDQWVGPAGTSPPPTYLLLLGDAVWDFKNNLNRSDWVDLVPTPIMFFDQAVLKYYAADNWLASFLGNDQSADILYGRIPARTAAQANTVFSKILGYALSPPAGAWRSDGYFVADVGNNSNETQGFELVGDSAATYFTPPWTFTKQYYAEPPYNAPPGGGVDVTQFKTDFVDHWKNSHPGVAVFTGHGAFDILGNDAFFRPADVPLLTNGSYLPFFFNSDCLTGGFHAVGVDSIGEAFLESPVGGSIAFFAPAGLSFIFFGDLMGSQIFSDLFSLEKIRELGTLTFNARDVLYQQGTIVDLQGYALLGDPSLELMLPAPRPPTGFTATAGNGQVDLAWTASSDPNAVGTNIYRTAVLSQPYTKINPSPVTATSFTDLSVTNGTTYFYRAVSVDAGGFEGGVTNTNADCGASGPPDGPQCRRATPKNLVPPVPPQGVMVRDTGAGSSLEISWNANSEPDIAKYLVYFGTSPGSHPTVRNAGPSTTYTLQGLTLGVTYYVVVSAVNTSGVEGSPSTEASGAPHSFFGIAPPRTIEDLMVTQSGNDLILTWGAVTTSIYGTPTTVDHYNIYRGSVPNFVPANGTNRIGMVAASSTPSFPHTGGATLPDDGFYLVSAVDLEGFASGLGGDLPSGVLTMDLQPSPTAGMLRLTWPAVTTTVGGQPAVIDHYTLYGSSAVLPRRLIGPGNLLVDGLTGPFIDVPDPSATRYYFNLVAVDRRGNISPY